MFDGTGTQLKDLLCGRRIFWQCFFGSYCVGLHEFLPIEAVGCLDEGSDFDLIRRDCGVHFCAVESPEMLRHNWIGAGIDIVFESQESKISQLLASEPGESWFVISSPASPRLEAFCRDTKLAYVGPTAADTVPFQPKRALASVIRQMALPKGGGEWINPGELDHRSLASRFGSLFVIQKDLASAGSGTFLVSSAADFETALDQLSGQPVLVSPFLGHLSLNINSAVVGREVCVGFPNVQLSGVKEIGAPWGGYCGNDYSAAVNLDQDLVGQVQAQTERVGDWLSERGFQGIYGLDFVINESDGLPYAVDLNPRWQGSTVLSIQSELEQGRLPLAAADFGYRCGILNEPDIRNWLEQFRQPIEGSQLCLRLPYSKPHRVSKEISPGVYRQGDGMDFVRDGISLSDCVSETEWLLTGGVPRKGTLVEGGAWLSRVYSKASVSNGQSSSELSGNAKQAARAFIELFGLQQEGRGKLTSRWRLK